MLKVCHILSGDLWAGAEAMVYQLLKSLCTCKGVSLSVVLLNEGRLAEKIRTLGVRLHVVDESRLSFFDILSAMRRILSEQAPDVIHSHRYKENILAYLASKSFTSPKLIATQHGMPEVYKTGGGLKRRFVSRSNFSLLSLFFHRTVGVSHNMKETLIEQYGFREDKIRVIHNGMEIPNMKERKKDGEDFVIGSAGRFYPVKDYPLMVEIAKAVSEKTGRIRFQLAGDGPERTRLQDLTRRYGLNGTFEFIGHLDEMASFYENLDLYLNTSVHEGIPMSILEAMALGLPVIAPGVGGLGEIVDNGIHGYLIEERNPEAFAEKCLLLYENRSLKREMSHAARKKVVQAFSMENMARKYHDLYVELVENG